MSTLHTKYGCVFTTGAPKQQLTRSDAIETRTGISVKGELLAPNATKQYMGSAAEETRTQKHKHIQQQAAADP